MQGRRGHQLPGEQGRGVTRGLERRQVERLHLEGRKPVREARGVEGDHVVARPLGLRPREPERRDGDTDQPGVELLGTAFAKAQALGRPRARALEHDVGPAAEPRRPLPALRARPDPSAGAPWRRSGSGRDCSGRRPPDRWETVPGLGSGRHPSTRPSPPPHRGRPGAFRHTVRPRPRPAPERAHRRAVDRSQCRTVARQPRADKARDEAFSALPRLHDQPASRRSGRVGPGTSRLPPRVATQRILSKACHRGRRHDFRRPLAEDADPRPCSGLPPS